MLPFLKKRQVAGLIIEKRKPDGGLDESGHTDNEDYGIKSCADELIRAMHAKDTDAVARALKDAFEILDSQPHEEGEHTNE